MSNHSLKNNTPPKVHIPTNLVLILRIAVIIAWLALMCIIFWFSSKPAATSTVQSHQVDEVICKIVIKDFHTFTLALKEYYIETVDKFVRKSAHFTEYAALGILSFLVASFSLPFLARLKNWLRLFLIPLAWCLLYSVTDELHQHFVEGRNAAPTDVLIDTAGAAVGLLLALLIRKIVMIIKSIKSRNKQVIDNARNK